MRPEDKDAAYLWDIVDMIGGNAGVGSGASEDNGVERARR